MAGEILLEKTTGKTDPEGESVSLGNLEDKVNLFLTKYQELKKERDGLAAALNVEREKMMKLEKKLELLSQDREKVKTRIDQLLHRLKGVDF